MHEEYKAIYLKNIEIQLNKMGIPFKKLKKSDVYPVDDNNFIIRIVNAEEFVDICIGEEFYNFTANHPNDYCYVEKHNILMLDLIDLITLFLNNELGD